MGVGQNEQVDRYELYERAVMSVDNDVLFIERAFHRFAHRAPRSLREDFCGTAALARAWVESDDDRCATAIDIDPEVLRYAERRRAELLSEEGDRLRLGRRDVRVPDPEVYDVITAMNFSWALLDDDALLEYLRNARACLELDGLLLLELFGGPELALSGVDEHREEGFVYRFERRGLDPATGRLEARIHFRLDTGEELNDAFVYSFRLRSLARLEELARAAGFSSCELSLEDRRGRYRRLRGRPRARRYRGMLTLSGARAR